MSVELQQFYQEAIGELKSLREVSKGIRERLEKGIDLDTAYEIIDRIWLPVEAMRLKTKLSSEFTRENSDAILYNPLSGNVTLLTAVPKTLNFLAKAFPEIINQVNEIYKQINSLDINDPAAMEKFNCFRKEPARFADYVKDLWYPDSFRLENQEVPSWKDIGNQYSKSVESGDYLLLLDYSQTIRDAQKSLEENLTDRMVSDQTTLSSVEYRVDQLLGMVELIHLFSNYLDDTENR